MLLNEIIDIPGLSYVCTNGKNLKDFDVKDITRDTREVKEGSLFIAVVGERIDGHDLIDEAISNGANVIVYCKHITNFHEDVCYIKVKDTREAMPLISMSFCHVTAADLKILGVTGTNGKTTSVFMMKHILETTGKKVGLIGTVANYIGDKKYVAERTTPESIELFKLIKEMKLAGCEFCVMEVSSHASVLGRTKGLRFERGMFSNLTQDHMDFHKTFEEYYKAKFKFIDSADSCVINVDDTYGQDMVLDSSKLTMDKRIVTTYGLNSGYFRAKNIDISTNGSSFDLYIGEDNKGRVNLHIPGLYNVYNALGVIATLVGYDYVTVEDVIKAFDTMKAVDGRCEKVYHEKLKSTVVVDYAHTPDGMDNILKTMREVATGRLISVFGCGGDRDASKRPIMSGISCQYSDLTIITSDNPRTEDPDLIIKDVVAGAFGEYKVIKDRKEAIEYAVSIADKDDIVLIMGKGHEDYQIIGTTKYHFSDKETVLNYLDKSE